MNKVAVIVDLEKEGYTFTYTDNLNKEEAIVILESTIKKIKGGK